MGTFEWEWKKRFERFASDNTDDHRISGWSGAGLRRRVAVFQELLNGLSMVPPRSILDLGCGAGTYVRFLAGLGHRVIGLDYSRPSLVRAISLDPGPTADYIVGDAYQLPFRDAAFDLVVSVGVLQTLESPMRAVDEISRVLRPQGIAIVDFLNANEVVTKIRIVLERLSGKPARLKTYDSFEVEQWFREKKMFMRRRAPVFLAPRNWLFLEKLVEKEMTTRIMRLIPGFQRFLAHAHFVVVQKSRAEKIE